MDERDFFDERQETKRASFACPHCRERADYDVRWLKRTKKLPCRAEQANKTARASRNPATTWYA
jgi:hypothetical protein